MATQTPEMTAAHVDWLLATTRLDAIRENVVREGMTPQSFSAFLESSRDLANAICAIDAARPGAHLPVDFDAPATTPACVCSLACADDPRTTCSLSGTWHVHPGQRCPVHPDVPRGTP